jgi:hypothetical protein
MTAQDHLQDHLQVHLQAPRPLPLHRHLPCLPCLAHPVLWERRDRMEHQGHQVSKVLPVL